jgi:hypothetical protein
VSAREASAPRGPGTRPFVFDRAWTFPVPAGELWSVLERTDRYPEWWTWLRELDADGLRPGAVAHCTIRPPLPYALRFRVELDQVEPGRLVAGQVRGDLHGPARLEIHPDGEGCQARLVWELRLGSPVLRRLSLVARPAMVWGHDRVVALGVRQFRHRALG